MKLPLLVSIMLSLTNQAHSADAPSGASLAWTSTDSTVVQARELISRGELSAAETMLHSAKAAAKGDPEAIDQTLEIIRRIRLLYPLNAEQMVTKLSPEIPGVKWLDIERWGQKGGMQHRMIDGRAAYFSREPANLFRFCIEAIALRVSKPAAGESKFDLLKHLAEIVAEAERSGAEQVMPVRHRVHFVLTVPANAKGAKVGSVVRAWLPYPQEYRQQSGVTLISASPGKPVVAENGLAHRTLFFEQKINDVGRPVVFDAVFEYVSHAYYPVLDDAKVATLPADFSTEDLAERPPHIRFSPLVKETASAIVGDETNPLVKARKIFHWVDANIRYNAEEEYSVIPSLSEHGLTRRRGDCGVQGSVFITLCRAAGVPARWQSGWQTLPGNHDMHDWTEIYIAPWGWLPVDPSYGVKKSVDPAIRDFYFGHQDSYRMIVNMDYGGSLQPAKKSLRSEPMDFQRGEVEIDGRNLYFDEFDYDFSSVQTKPQR